MRTNSVRIFAFKNEHRRVVVLSGVELAETVALVRVVLARLRHFGYPDISVYCGRRISRLHFDPAQKFVTHRRGIDELVRWTRRQLEALK